MDLSHARAAADEASASRLTDRQVKWLADKCRHEPVRDHRINFDPGKWPELPGTLTDGSSITRRDVFDLANGPALDVFTASYVFGMGTVGYGRSRYDKIRAAAPDLGAILDGVREIGLCLGPVLAYAQLYGGSDHDCRTSPGTAPWSRIDAYGPAFFTKFLYFTVPGALILDARLAGRVAQLTGREYGYLAKGRPVAWTPYRYAVYLHWMRQTAAAISVHTAPRVVSPELLELTLFGLDPAGLGD